MSDEISKQRTLQQNSALHLYLTQVANELVNQGQTMQNVVKEIKKVEITPTMYNLKEMVWREIQKAHLGKDSTTFLTKQEVNEIYDIMSKWLAVHFEIDIPFPVDEEKAYEVLKPTGYREQ